jgi:hypothetical protein
MESDRLPVAFHIAATPLGLASDLARRAGLHGRDDAMGAPFSHAQDDSHCDLAPVLCSQNGFEGINSL